MYNTTKCTANKEKIKKQIAVSDNTSHIPIYLRKKNSIKYNNTQTII